MPYTIRGIRAIRGDPTFPLFWQSTHHCGNLPDMIRKILVFAGMIATALACYPQAPQTAVLFEGARLIPGDGRQPVVNAAMLVENGIITRVGTKGSVNAPASTRRVDLTGKTIMPVLINAHGHPGFQRGLTYSRD